MSYTYKEEFIRFMVDNGVLKFGQFTLKSGRIAPYFINTGNYKTGKQLAKLGEYYAACAHCRECLSALYNTGSHCSSCVISCASCNRHTNRKACKRSSVFGDMTRNIGTFVYFCKK